MTARAQMLWTFAITSIALFMVTLDNLVVTTGRRRPRGGSEDGVRGVAELDRWARRPDLVRPVTQRLPMERRRAGGTAT
jgi:hypothetical protein